MGEISNKQHFIYLFIVSMVTESMGLGDKVVHWLFPITRLIEQKG